MEEVSVLVGGMEVEVKPRFGKGVENEGRLRLGYFCRGRGLPIDIKVTTYNDKCDHDVSTVIWFQIKCFER